MSTVISVTTEAGLNGAIDQADAATAGTFVIELANDVNETFTVDAVNLNTGVTLTIDGQGRTLDGAEAYRGFFAYAGALSIENLSIRNTVARGGFGGYPGAGGGAGLGGGLFVAGANAGLASGAVVTLNNVNFYSDSAAGGAGGGSFGSNTFDVGGSATYAGGGGLGGFGGASEEGGGGGGGIGGRGGGGPTAIENGSPGIIVGAGSAGAGGSFTLSGTPPTTLAGGVGGAAGGGGGGGANTFYVPGGGGGIGGGTPATTLYFNPSAGVGGNGGFGGGGGGGATGGNGGFGGGGGSGGGNGGFGGGGASNTDQSGTGVGGFGGGSGAVAAPFVYEGGGGLGAGGALFVQQGGSLIIDGGNLIGNSVSGGAGGRVLDYTPLPSTQGSAFGSAIFLQGNQVLAFSEAAGNGTTITDVITDQTGSGGTGANAGSGSIVLQGQGYLKLAGNDSYTGGTTVNSGTLSLPGFTSAGTGAITFANRGPSAIVLDIVPSQLGGALLPNAVLGFSAGDTIFEQEFAYSPDASAVLSGQSLLVSSGGRSGTISLPDAAPGSFYAVTPGSSYGGIAITTVANTTVTTEAALSAAIDAADGATSGAYRITLASDIRESFTLDAVNLHAGVTLTIDGQGHTLDGANFYRGFFAYAGSLAIQNLAIVHTVATGGDGLVAAGGGAGLGGGLFVTGSNPGLTSGAAVTLSNVSFVADGAVGGISGSNVNTHGFGGGGGLGGDGGDYATPGAGGGGGGIGVLVASEYAGNPGIVPEAASGGDSAFFLSGPYYYQEPAEPMAAPVAGVGSCPRPGVAGAWRAARRPASIILTAVMAASAAAAAAAQAAGSAAMAALVEAVGPTGAMVVSAGAAPPSVQEALARAAALSSPVLTRHTQVFLSSMAAVALAQAAPSSFSKAAR